MATQTFSDGADGKVISNRINSAALDQWRGIALILVLISHGFSFTSSVAGLGRVGVNLFFFISGILVFRSLSSTLPLASFLTQAVFFWRRRFFRLYPALIAYLFAMAGVVLALQREPGMTKGSDIGTYMHTVLYAVFCIVNYAFVPLSLGHLWSVSVEIQFYALAPIIYFLGGRSDRQRLVVWISILIILFLLGLVEPLRGYRERYHFQVASWPMMLGFLLEYRKHWGDLIPPKWSRRIILLGTILLIITLILTSLNMGKAFVVATGSGVLIPCFLCYLTSRSIPGVTGKGLRWIGERTYSIYLWQEPFTLCGYLPAAAYPLGAVASTVVGAIWYRFFERPFLSSKRRKIVDTTVEALTQP